MQLLLRSTALLSTVQSIFAKAPLRAAGLENCCRLPGTEQVGVESRAVAAATTTGLTAKGRKNAEGAMAFIEPRGGGGKGAGEQ